MAKPYEIIMSPFEVYIAAVGSTMPDVDETPTGDWSLLGTNGKRNITDDGVTVTHDQTINEHRNAGHTGIAKVHRTEESLTIDVELDDMTLETYAKALNDASITTTAAEAGVPGTKDVNLYRGQDVSVYALVVRGASPYGDGWGMQYEVPRCFQSASPAPQFNKGDAATLALTFTAIEDPDASTESERFGKLRDQTADAT